MMSIYRGNKTLCAFAPLIAIALLAGGCNSGSSGSAPSGPVLDNPPILSSTGDSSSNTAAPAPAPAAPATPAAPNPGNSNGPDANSPVGSNAGPAGPSQNVQVGESCTGGGADKLCLAVHFVTYKNSTGAPVANTDQAATIIRTMNQLWNQCNIGFQIEKYEMVDPAQYGLSFGAQSQNEVDQIRQQFKDPTNELLAVTTGPWGTAVNAWTSMPGEGVYGAIMEASIVGYGAGIIYAHEFGHYLGLGHPGDTSNLMNPIVYTSSTALTSDECQVARQTATSDWSAMLRN